MDCMCKKIAHIVKKYYVKGRKNFFGKQKTSKRNQSATVPKYLTKRQLKLRYRLSTPQQNAFGMLQLVLWHHVLWKTVPRNFGLWGQSHHCRG